MKFEKVLLASDFDGTLKNDAGEITPETIEKIQYFMREGGRFTVSTGRILQGFHLYDPAYINAPVLLGNGACAYDYETKATLFNDGIGAEGIGAMRGILQRFPGISIEFYHLQTVCAVNPGDCTEHHFTSQYIDFHTVALPEEAPLPWTKVMIPAKGFSKEVQQALDEYPEVNYLRTTGDYIEVLKKGVDKGSGLRKLAGLLGVAEKDTYAAGDGYNDVEMLVAARAGFVPENGSKEALAAATYVTRSNNDGCIVHAIEILDALY